MIVLYNWYMIPLCFHQKDKFEIHLKGTHIDFAISNCGNANSNSPNGVTESSWVEHLKFKFDFLKKERLMATVRF